MTTYSLRKGSPDKARTDAVVVGVTSGRGGLVAAPGGEPVQSAYGRRFAPLLASLGFKGSRGEVVRIPTAGTLRSPLLVLVGLGDAESLSPDVVRRAAGLAARSVSNAAHVSLALPADDAELVRAVVEGYRLGGYSFDRYKSHAATDRPGEVAVLTPIARTKVAAEARDLAGHVATAVERVRDWVNTPAGDLTPATFAAEADGLAGRGSKVTAEVLDHRQLEKQGFGGIIGVGRASANPPRLLRLTYRPRHARRHLALVGKGITFDSGGLWIKPASSMTTMKCDMGGAAAVVAATFAVADLGLPVTVTTLAPLAENMVSGEATRPGDVLTMFGGRTVEVLNPDAEGRLVLADAIVLAAESEPDLLVDVATLTGACETALGDRVSGVLGNDPGAVERVRRAGAASGEKLWELPISPEMTEKVRTYSKVADLMQHNVDGYGGALYAAAFLQEFVPDGLPWAHLDIAGTAFNKRSPFGHVPRGGTGVAAATLVQLARDLADDRD